VGHDRHTLTEPLAFDFGERVVPIASSVAADFVEHYHYLHRVPPIESAFGMLVAGEIKGVLTIGTPASRHLQISACASSPDLVRELNRLWVDDGQPKNTESWFIARCLALLSPLILVSYADTAVGHVGYVYRAANWRYAGWTDMDRPTPRLDYVPIAGGHTREATRSGILCKVRRKPKHRYWTVTGNRSDRRRLRSLVTWPDLAWTTR
jgi:hypothetical protein